MSEQHSRGYRTRSRHTPLIISHQQGRLLHLKLLWARAMVLSSFFSLLGLFCFLTLSRDDGSFSFLLVESLPLLIFTPGLVRDIRRASHRTYSWLCFVMLIYFVAIVPIVMGRGSWSDWVITALVCILFIASMMSARWLQYWHYYQASRDKPGSHSYHA